MSTTTLASHIHGESVEGSIQQQVGTMIDELIAELPNPDTLSSAQRHGIIARYSGVLEGNFIYWMTATSIAAKADEVRPIFAENLFEECRDAHPAMLRRFAVAAHAYPTDTEALSTNDEVLAVRLFLGKLQGVQSVLTMAFFEGWIQRFMGYLGDLATAEGSKDLEYTNVHGVCDVHHTAELYRALALEMAVNPVSPETNLFEGVDLLRTLIRAIIDGPKTVAA
jgi:hypothetical protein